MAARYDDSAEAATSVILKMTPLLFGFLLSLSGSVGPVVGQNLALSVTTAFERRCGAVFKL